MNSSFLSPLKKLDNLNLNNLSDITEDDYDAANKTIDESIDLDKSEIVLPLDECSGGSDSEHEAQLISQRPVYVNKRKRINTSDIEMITPVSRSISNSNDPSNNMSICSNITSTSLSNLKLSFSNSDSTPCPVPAKKKFRYDQNTPITKKKLLDFSHSIKTKIDDNDGPQYPSIHDNELDDNDNEINDDDDDNEYNDDDTKLELNYHTNPISQSTPSNSRIPSPKGSRRSTPVKSNDMDVHGSPDDSYQTPIFESRKTIMGYSLINKEVESHMYAHQNTPSDESEDDDSFAGNARINDPYLTEPQSDTTLRHQYLNDTTKLPLLVDYQNLPKAEILSLITPDNVLKFYETIILDEPMTELLKNERVKWHPDKRSYVNRFDPDVINAVSQCLNSMFDNL